MGHKKEQPSKKKLKKNIKWNTYVDANLDEKLKAFMERFEISNQAKTLRQSVACFIDSISFLDNYKTPIPPKDFEKMQGLLREAVRTYYPGTTLFGEIQQPLSPLKTPLLMLNDVLDDPKKVKNIVPKTLDAVKKLEDFVRSRLREPTLNRHVKELDILYIEDNELDREVIHSYFEDKGVNIRSVATSDDALEVLKDHTPKLIFSDVYLDGSKMNGDKLCKVLKGKQEYENIPFILISALVSEKEKTLLLTKSGADDILFKPIESLKVLDKIIEYYQ